MVPAPIETVFAATSIVPPSMEVLPPSSNEPGCQLESTAPEMRTASAGTAPEMSPTMRSFALMLMGADRPPLAAAVRTNPATSSESPTCSASVPASAGSGGRGAPAAAAAAVKYFDAEVTLYSAS